ncbi:MAG: ATP-binding protein [Anaerolineae bacterium]
MDKLWIRLSLSFSAILIVVVMAMVAVISYANQSASLEALVIASISTSDGALDRLVSLYRAQGNWDQAVIVIEQLQRRIAPGTFDMARIILADEGGQVIYDSHPDESVPFESYRDSSNTILIDVDGRIRGYLHIDILQTDILNDTFQAFALERLTQALLAVTIIGGICGIVVGVLTSRWLTTPLTRLEFVARAIGNGHRELRIDVQGTSEVREVARAFNSMIDVLQEAEGQRRNLVADIAHELRTPLSVLHGNLYALLEDVYTISKEQVARLYDETRLLNRLVGDLHDLSQAEARQLSMNLQMIDLNTVLREEYETFQPLAEAKQVQFIFQPAPNPLLLRADRERMQQVIHNLLSNALRYTPAQGRIQLTGTRQSGYISVVIEDTGEGIAEEHLPYIFDRFYRADPSRERSSGGTGLGLAIARAIVEAHQGAIQASSDGLGCGSRFEIRFLC